MRAARLALVVTSLSLLAPLTVVTSTSAGAAGQAPAQVSAPAVSGSAAESAVAKAARQANAKKGSNWVPPVGALLSDPMVPGQNRNILQRVITAINNTAKREYIRVVVWNYDDRPVTNALLAADRRGVHVQIVVAGSVENANWARTRKQLNAKKDDKSFALKCTGGCRSQTKIMHAKYITFSRIHKAKNISMFGSFNLTTPAGNRQWNDMITTRNHGLYTALEQTFNEYANDIIVAAPYKVTDLGKYKVTLFPAFNRNPILEELKKVSCAGTTGGAGNENNRTTIRIAIAGWFDAFGNDIARQVRNLWERGCDIRIITTLAGRGVNRALKAPGGRGPVPIKEVTYDPNQDGIPERYLHMKNIAISGVFDGDTAANVIITGSPNWSTRGQKSDEILFRILKANKMVRQYTANTDRLYFGPWAHDHVRPVPEELLERGAAGTSGGVPNLRTGENVPDWFELD
jgi:phosphatidylserine/phosphatidylglycerophosphate/cardiolipin synthase-like enzyme